MALSLLATVSCSERLAIVFILSMLWLPPSAVARDRESSTRLVPVSGVLTQADGQPLAGPLVVTFALYDAPEHGTLLWSESQEVKADEHGRYTSYLGSTTPLPQAAFSQEQARWLAVEVQGRQMRA